MKTPASVVAGVDFGDPAFAARVRDGVARVEDLIATELRGADELMTEAVLHLFEAGGKRFRPLFTVLAAHVGPDPENHDVTVAGAVIDDALAIACGSGAVRLVELQRAGGKPVKAAEFLRGLRAPLAAVG